MRTEVSHIPPREGHTFAQKLAEVIEMIGAGSRDRTGILSLEGCCTTIVLYPRRGASV